MSDTIRVLVGDVVAGEDGETSVYVGESEDGTVGVWTDADGIATYESQVQANSTSLGVVADELGKQGLSVVLDWDQWTAECQRWAELGGTIFEEGEDDF